MGRQRERYRGKEQGGSSWREPGFWEEVADEVSVETMRWSEFALFAAPTDPSREPDPAFTVDLREHLRRLVRRLYTS